MTPNRHGQLVALRTRLNGEGHLRETAATADGYAFEVRRANDSSWNRKRIRIHNRINARLRGLPIEAKDRA